MQRNTQLSAVALVLIASIAAVALWKQGTVQDFYTTEVKQRADLEWQLVSKTETDFTVGAPDAKMRLLIFGDGDCPFCKVLEPRLTQLLETYPEDVAITYRHYKLPIYPTSKYEHIALECVGILAGADQYRTFQNEVVFENVFSEEEDVLLQVTTMASDFVTEENRSALIDCITNPETQERIADKVATGNILGVRKTPTFFVIDEATRRHKMYVGGLKYEPLVQAINTFLGTDNQLAQ